jgi:hypothetical protein
MVPIADSFEIKREHGLSHALGVVVVFEVPRNMVIPTVGARVELRRPGAESISLPIREIKDHGSRDATRVGKSFFFEGLTLKDVPQGTELHW